MVGEIVNILKNCLQSVFLDIKHDFLFNYILVCCISPLVKRVKTKNPSIQFDLISKNWSNGGMQSQKKKKKN